MGIRSGEVVIHYSCHAVVLVLKTSEKISSNFLCVLRVIVPVSYAYCKRMSSSLLSENKKYIFLFCFVFEKVAKIINPSIHKSSIDTAI
jgi:hypothetical protein